MWVCLLVLQTIHDKNTKGYMRNALIKMWSGKTISHNFHGKLRLTTCGLWTNVRS